ncbi:MAG: glycosyltransferase family 9 protein [Thermodesulfobacteriota bacterium]
MSTSSILVIHHGALGDLILTYPILETLKLNSYNIHLLCRRSLGDLTCALGFSEKGFALESQEFVSLYSDSMANRMKELLKSYDAILLFSYSDFLSNNIQEQLDIPVFRIPPRPEAGLKIHVAGYLLSQFFSSGVIAPPVLSSEEFFCTWGKPIKRVLSNRVWIHPGAGSREKMWPFPNFIKTAHLLRSLGLEPVFIFGPAEYELQESLIQSGSDFENRLISEILEFVDFFEEGARFLGNDSGVTHLAAYLGMATLAIFGPSDPVRWRPLGQRVETLRPDTDCPPCFENGKRDCENKICFSGTTPHLVASRIKTFLQPLNLGS